MPKTLPPAEDPVSQFEAAMKELETLVQQLEQGDLPLEASLSVFERGVTLAQQCRTTLETATQRVENVLERTTPDE
ncbi:exodeoxyribonuclease VII small subunit [Flagellatimonas centrodinii]|uniref:exodeoxyribonuclease VII small subunit n=1 Tax=Flagellatimonas centrodinii TaxID=2806210 RepID=UPI001FEFD092|nr:exodeoxyribonuclease VII small subunit [Flagellatimonas centrodinii]ULQ46680.1 exodeoxyribonuclease VII small subunit [Flagellatimonas centrodinii]